MPQFLARIAECLDRPSVGADCRFRETEGWSSLTAFSILVTLEQDFGRRMTVDELMGLETVGDLARACGIA